MIFVLIFIVSLVLLSIYNIREDGEVIGGILFSILESILTTLIIGFIAFVIISSNSNIEKIVLSDTQLYALQDSNSVQGTFFLGSGNIDGTMKYVYLIKEDNGYRMQTIKSDSVNINETDSNPHIIFYKDIYTNKKVNFWLGGDPPAINIYSPIIYVPKGTIKYNFNVDLK